MKPLIVIGSSVDPYKNLAIEETLLRSCEDRRILYLWQNDRTVVIGRHQDAKAECDLEKMKEDGVLLSKRISGGGAVYHDMGNMNFTFIAPRGVLSVDEDFQSGPDDKSPCFHHGTILCSCDIEKMVQYLTPSSAKLERHGVQSVRARVTNLGLEIKDVKESIIRVFEHRYGEADRAGEDIADAAQVEEARQRLSSQEWLFSI